MREHVEKRINLFLLNIPTLEIVMRGICKDAPILREFFLVAQEVLEEDDGE